MGQGQDPSQKLTGSVLDNRRGRQNHHDSSQLCHRPRSAEKHDDFQLERRIELPEDRPGFRAYIEYYKSTSIKESALP